MEDLKNSIRRAELTVDMSDKAYSDAIIRVIMAKHSGIRIRCADEETEAAENSYILRDSPGGAALFGPADNKNNRVLAYFRRGERVSTVTDRISDLSGCGEHAAGDADGHAVSDLSAECVAFIASCGGAGTTTLAKTIGRLAYRDLGERCLYISLAPYVSETSGSRKNTMTRMMYKFMSDGRSELRSCCTEERGVFVIENSGVNPEAAGFSPELLSKLRTAAKASGFGYVFLDIGNHLEKDRVRLLESCGRVVSVHREGRRSVSFAGSGLTVDVENFCSSENPENGAVRLGDMGRMDGANPPAEYCEKARRVITLLEIGSGQGKTAARR